MGSWNCWFCVVCWKKIIDFFPNMSMVKVRTENDSSSYPIVYGHRNQRCGGSRNFQLNILDHLHRMLIHCHMFLTQQLRCHISSIYRMNCDVDRIHNHLDIWNFLGPMLVIENRIKKQWQLIPSLILCSSYNCKI